MPRVAVLRLGPEPRPYPLARLRKGARRFRDTTYGMSGCRFASLFFLHVQDDHVAALERLATPPGH